MTLEAMRAAEFSKAVPLSDSTGNEREPFSSFRAACGSPQLQFDGAASTGSARVFTHENHSVRVDTCRPDGLGLLRRGDSQTDISKERNQ